MTIGKHAVVFGIAACLAIPRSGVAQTVLSPSSLFAMAVQGPTVTPEQVDQLIDQLGSDDFDTRQAAQAELFSDAQQSRDNAILIRDRLRAKGLTSDDAEIVDRSNQLLDSLHKLGAFTLKINDGGENLDDPEFATSDDAETSIHIFHDPLRGEVVAMQDVFFDFHAIPLNNQIFFIEALNGDFDPSNAPVSDALMVYEFEANGLGGFSHDGRGLLFVSDDNDNLGHVDCNQAFVTCIAETGAPQEIANIYFGPNSIISIQVTSDVEASAPEPSTFVLTGTGLAAVLGATARRRRS